MDQEVAEEAVELEEVSPAKAPRTSILSAIETARQEFISASPVLNRVVEKHARNGSDWLLVKALDDGPKIEALQDLIGEDALPEAIRWAVKYALTAVAVASREG